MVQTATPTDFSHHDMETPVCEIKMCHKNICMMTFFPDVQVTLDEMKTIEKALLQVTGGTPFMVIMDIRNRYIQFDSDARDYAATEPITKILLAEAILLNNLPSRLLYNFYLKFNRPDYPIRAFTHPEPALEWLKSF